jgi:ubiquinone/menaquinone biosynthesis C-methylase UbiE
MPSTEPATISTATAVRDMYDATADQYASMMDAEIDLPLYDDTLGRLAGRIQNLRGPVVDSACGSGHMLARLRERHAPDRAVLGVDLSPRMVAITAARLGPAGEVEVGDMTRLSGVPSGSAAAVLNFFALHHLDPTGVQDALGTWHRVLAPGGQLVVAAWEGEGVIDYGEHADLVALRTDAGALRRCAEGAGFQVSRCVVEPVEGFPMDAVYLEASRAEPG